MTDRNRLYVIFEQMGDSRAYLSRFDEQPESSTIPPYAWASSRFAALRIRGKTQAKLCATALEAAIRKQGYTPSGIRVQPASGGMCVWR